LAYPDEQWDWERFDLFTLGNIDALLSDEFLDGDLTQWCLDNVITNYAKLKKLRKMFKLAAHKDMLSSMLEGMGNDLPANWLSQYLSVFRQVEKESGDEYIRKMAILCQTRACGTPPALPNFWQNSNFWSVCQNRHCLFLKRNMQ